MTVLLASIVDVTIVMALALVAAAALKGRSAALRHAVLAAAIVAAALSPALELVVPQLPVVDWNDAAPAVSSGTTLTSGAAPAGSGAMAAAAPAGPAIPWITVLLAVWMLGAMVTLTGLLTGLVRLARLTARCTPVRAGRWREMADDLSRAYALRRPVALLQSTDPSLLVTCGVLRPKIILPAGAAAWTDDRRRIVLAHEMAHVRRRDGAMQLAGEVLRVIHWFNPLVWVSCRRLRQESEYACDDAVLSGGIDATDYATHLLGVARHAVGRHHAWASAPAIAHPSTLERRISAMLNRQRNREPLTRRAWAVAVLAAVVVIVPLAAAGVAPPPESRLVALADAGDITLAAPTPAAPEPTPVPDAAPPEPPARTATAVAAQQAPATISGTMTDQSGGVLPGVQLTLTDTEFGVQNTVRSDGAGRFRFRDLQPARYELVASLPGFATVTNIMPLAAGATVERIITLPVGMLQETITVNCAAPVARKSSVLQYVRTSVDGGGTPLLWRNSTRATPPVAAQAPSPAAQDPRPVRVGGVIKAPRQLSNVAPRCPPLLPPPGTVVTLTGRIGVDGYMNEVRMVEPAPGEIAPLPEFVDAALDAVRQWTYTPTLLNNVTVEVTVQVTVYFGG